MSVAEVGREACLIAGSLGGGVVRECCVFYMAASGVTRRCVECDGEVRDLIVCFVVGTCDGGLAVSTCPVGDFYIYLLCCAIYVVLRSSPQNEMLLT